MRFVPFLIIPALIGACSTVREEQASQDYKPVYPVEIAHQANVLPTGSIYTGSKNGLFATDRRAAQVGDILTLNFRGRCTPLI